MLLKFCTLLLSSRNLQRGRFEFFKVTLTEIGAPGDLQDVQSPVDKGQKPKPEIVIVQHPWGMDKTVKDLISKQKAAT
jgi:hypothetical protein